MKQILTIPEHSDELITEQFTINLTNKKANVYIMITDEEMNRTMKNVTVDIPSHLINQNFTESEIGIFKTVLKSIIAKAWGVSPSEITEDIF